MSLGKWYSKAERLELRKKLLKVYKRWEAGEVLYLGICGETRSSGVMLILSDCHEKGFRGVLEEYAYDNAGWERRAWMCLFMREWIKTEYED